jgi:hypothetical protein
MPPSLHILEETGAAGFRVWPDPEPIPPGAIQETRAYLFELRDAPDAPDAELLIDDMPLEALRSRRPDLARWRWSPGFHAGAVEAALDLPGAASRRFEIVTDPDVRKLTRADFDGMVREILEDTFALFSLTSFRKGVARGAGKRPPPIARLEFLRSRIADIDVAVRAIARNPRRILHGEETPVPCYRAARATGPEILKSFRSGRVGREANEPSRLPALLQGHLPKTIRLRRRRDSVDISEHRELKACLKVWAAWLLQVADLLGPAAEAPDDEHRRVAGLWKRRTTRMARALAALVDLPAFCEVGVGPARLLMSPIWRNDPAYRRFFRLHRDMSLGIAALFGDFLQMPLARTFELYELWCFLRLVRAAGELYGADGVDLKTLFLPDASGGVTVAAGAVVVPTGGGLKLCFQRQFREFWNEADGRGSFSRTMTPDVALMRAEPYAETKPLIILDAKYRIDEGLNAALNSIHTYRDALVREATTGAIEGIVRAAYLLTPYVPAFQGDYRGAAMPNRLFHPEYRSAFRFGAVTLRPGMTIPALQDALRVVLDDAASEPAAP